MKYDWVALKGEYIKKSLTDGKYTLKDFAEEKGISYSLLRKKSVGWREEKGTKQEQKSNKLLEKTIENQIESEAEMNLKHYLLASDLMGKIERKIEEMPISELSATQLNLYAKTLKVLQDVQRTATDADQKSGEIESVVNEFMKAVEESETNEIERD